MLAKTSCGAAALDRRVASLLAMTVSAEATTCDCIAIYSLAFEGDSRVEWFEGNFVDYEEDKKRRLQIDSIIPHRLKYKKFSR
jgi:hypothetical protein